MNRTAIRRDLLVSLLLVAVVVAIAAYSSSSTARSEGTSLAPSFNTIAGSAHTFDQGIMAAGGSRVVQVSQGITGTVNYGSFERVATQLVNATGVLDGYVQSSELTYSGNLWHGTWTLQIPTSNSQGALFRLRSMIASNGRIDSIAVSTLDVTQETHGNASAVQYSPVQVSIQESSTSPATPVSAAIGMLGDAANTVVYFGIIAVPAYFGILGLILASRKLLLPMMKKAAKA